MKINIDGKYQLEEDIHRIIHPLRVSSEEIEFEKQNLWIVDERLAYHKYLASDKPFKKTPVIDTQSTKEADILAYFENAHAFAEDGTDFQSIVIIEFKRPGRDDYDGSENPLDQIGSYVSIIRDGKAKTLEGRIISNKNIPIYAYIICDLTESLQRIIRLRGYTSIYDGSGYYYFHPELRYYVEIITFDKMIRDAERRNKVLFEKLGILN